MTELVDLQAYRIKAVEQRGFRAWHKRFGETYGAKTKLADLSDSTLYILALPGEKTAVAFYELILGILGLGEALKFYYLPTTDQMMVVDIHLFLADQVRFELMRRLGWLTSFPGEKYTLIEMVQRFKEMKAENKTTPPKLSKAQPDFDVYDALTNGDKDAFVRRKLQKALEDFRIRLAT